MSRRRKRSGGSRLAAVLTTLCMFFLMGMVPFVLIAAARQPGEKQEEAAVQIEEKISKPESVPEQTHVSDIREGEEITAEGKDNLLILVNAQYPMSEDYAIIRWIRAPPGRCVK